jgi:hypothetical protein
MNLYINNSKRYFKFKNFFTVSADYQKGWEFRPSSVSLVGICFFVVFDRNGFFGVFGGFKAPKNTKKT